MTHTMHFAILIDCYIVFFFRLFSSTAAWVINIVAHFKNDTQHRIFCYQINFSPDKCIVIYHITIFNIKFHKFDLSSEHMTIQSKATLKIPWHFQLISGRCFSSSSLYCYYLFMLEWNQLYQVFGVIQMNVEIMRTWSKWVKYFFDEIFITKINFWKHHT